MFIPLLVLPHTFTFRGNMGDMHEVLPLGNKQIQEAERFGRETFLRLDTLEESTEIYSTFNPIDNNKLDIAGNITPMIHLPENRPLVPTIDRLAAFVAHVIGEFEPLF
jgi:hypothetical protein